MLWAVVFELFIINKLKMWLKIEVYNGDSFIGSFYTNESKKSEIIKDINNEYGVGNWTRYNIGN